MAIIQEAGHGGPMERPSKELIKKVNTLMAHVGDLETTVDRLVGCVPSDSPKEKGQGPRGESESVVDDIRFSSEIIDDTIQKISGFNDRINKSL